jgi:hypothetical protein
MLYQYQKENEKMLKNETTTRPTPNHRSKGAMGFTAAICALTLLAVSSAHAGVLTIQPYTYFSTAAGFSDGDISVYAGAAKWAGVTDRDSSATHSGTFGDGTVLDYRFVGTDRGAGVMKEHANGGGTYLTSAFTVGTYGTSGGGNSGLDVWTTTDPDAVGSFDTTPDSNSWGNDHVTGGDQLRGVIDVSGLTSAQIYFVYGSYKNAATIDLGTAVAGNDLGTLSLPFDGPDSDRLVIQEVTIDNSDSTYGIIHFNYSASANNGRGRFAGVIVDGTPVPEPTSAMAILALSGLALARRRG